MRYDHMLSPVLVALFSLIIAGSLAACAVMGRSAYGWLEWKTDQGQTLDGAKRQSVSLADA